MRETLMNEDRPAPTLTGEEARGGKELGVMRYVLHISLGLAVLAGIVVFFVMRHP